MAYIETYKYYETMTHPTPIYGRTEDRIRWLTHLQTSFNNYERCPPYCSGLVNKPIHPELEWKFCHAAAFHNQPTWNYLVVSKFESIKVIQNLQFYIRKEQMIVALVLNHGFK